MGSFYSCSFKAGAQIMKQQFRAQLKEERANIPVVYRELWQRQIAEHLLAWEPFQKADKVMVYLSTGWEVDTWFLVEELRGRGVEIYVPVVQKNPKKLVPTRYFSKDRLVSADFGILEPPSGTPTIDPLKLDLIIVPGLAFTNRGYRIGYGGGYYDRFLVSTTAPTVGLCFTAFIRDLPIDEWDKPVDFLATEEGIRGGNS